jgi:hypothetical protein
MSDTHKGLLASAILVQNPAFVLREEEDDAALLFDPDLGAVRVLNGTALAVWKRLDGKRNLSRIVADLREEFEGIDEAAERQVAELLSALSAMGAVGTVAEPCS